jgi:hypothetical protein
LNANTSGVPDAKPIQTIPGFGCCSRQIAPMLTALMSIADQ